MKNSSENEMNEIFRRVLFLSIPMILSNITVPLLGAVDIAVIGHLHNANLMGGVSVATTILNFIFWILIFLRMSTSGLIAQAFGKKDSVSLRMILGQSVLLATFLGCILLLLKNVIIYFAIKIIQPAPEVAIVATHFIKIAIWAAPAVLINYSLFGWFLGVQNTRIPLYIVVGSNLFTILLDYLFVYYFGLAVSGLAIVFIISQYLTMFLGIIFVAKILRNYSGKWQLNLICNFAKIKNLLSLNKNIFIRSLCLVFIYGFFTTQGARQGTIILAVNAVLMNFQMIMAFSLDGFANAVESLVGEAIGAKNRTLLFSAIRSTAVCAFIIVVIYSLIYSMFGVKIISLMTNVIAVREAAIHYLPWIIISPFICVWSYLLDGIFIGATRAKEMRNTMIVSAFLVFIPIWYFTQHLGNHGLWIFFFSYMLARALCLAFIMWKIEIKTGFIQA